MTPSTFDREVQAVFDRVQAPGGAVFPSPEDWRDACIYFLMVDRFNNAQVAPKNTPFDAQFSEFHGGTFNGIRQKLGYLKDLGIGALWLSPVLKNCQFDDHAYHGYGIQNFLAVQPRFGSKPELAESELRSLVDQAHRLGIYGIFDIVLHHPGDVFEYVIGGQEQAEAASQDQPKFTVRWRDEHGVGNPQWTQASATPPLDAAVFPDELRRDVLVTQRGNALSNGFHPNGDFNSLKGIDSDVTENGLQPAHMALIPADQYIVAKFEVDGFRIDTLKFISPDLARISATPCGNSPSAPGRRTCSHVARCMTTITRLRCSSDALPHRNPDAERRARATSEAARPRTATTPERVWPAHV